MLDITQLPEEDQRWLAFVKRYDRLLIDYPQFKPLRRYLHGRISETYKPKPVTRKQALLRYAHQQAIRLRNVPSIKPADILFFTEDDRASFNSMLNNIVSACDNADISYVKAVRNDIAGWNDIAVYPDYIHTIPDAGHDFSNAVESEFQAKNLKARTLELLTKYYGMRQYAQRLIKMVKPHALIMTYDQYLASATLAQVASENGVRSFVLQHGAPIAYQYPIQTDHILVWGDADYEYFTGLGLAPEQVLISGSSRHDEFAPSMNTRTKRNRLLLISNGNNEDRNGALPQRAYNWLHKIRAEYGDQYDIYVRYHPQEMDKYRAMGATFQQELNNIPFKQAIEHTDIIIGYVSTGLLETCLIGRPVLQLIRDDQKQLLNANNDQLTINITSYEAFKQTINRLQTISYYENIVERQQQNVHRYFANHPHASRSIVSIVSSAIRHSLMS